MKANLLYFIFFITALNLSAQEYISPLNIPLSLSSNFGEIRSNHFHSGVDFKTGGVEGKDVIAIAAGYVTRIYVSPSGFGKALYVFHPTTQTTSVYAHLQCFSPEIEKYVKREQYNRKSFFVNLFPKKDAFIVLQGEEIAKSGNSGSSGGPHLHFEIRNASSFPLNVIAKGIYSVKDNIPPRIHSVSLVRVDTVKGVPIHTVYKKIATKKVGLNYELPSGALEIVAPTYFVIEVSERKTASSNIYGIYSMNVTRNKKPYFEFKIDEFSFGITRYVNTFCKFPETTENRNDKIRTYISPNNKLAIYNNVVARGIIKPENVDGLELINVVVADDSRNSTSLSFSIKGRSSRLPITLKDVGKPIWWKKGGSIDYEEIRVSIAENALYESVLLDVKKLPKRENTLTSVYSISPQKEMLQKPIIISFDMSSLPESQHSKAVVVSVRAGKTVSLGGVIKSGRLVAKSSRFGDFSLAIDNVKPTIKPLYNSAELQKNYLSFKITDNLSGISSYRAKINGVWALLEYDPKRKLIRHSLKDGIAQKGVNQIEVRVSDSRNNIKIYKGTFKVDSK